MGIYFSALTIVIALFFIRGEAGYLIAVVCLCYVVFDLISAYSESKQKKMQEEMRELGKKLHLDEEEELEEGQADSGIESDDDLDVTEGEMNGEEAAENDNATSEELEDGNVDSDIEAEEADTASEVALEEESKTAVEEVLSEEELEERERFRRLKESLTPEMKLKFKGLEGKELERAVARHKVEVVLNNFDSSTNKTA